MKSVLHNRALLFVGAAIVLLVDQLSKFWVLQNFSAYTPVDFFPWLSAIFSFTYVQNTGVAFGLFPQLSIFFTVLSTLVILGILVFQRSIPGADYWMRLPLGLVVGGALGNLLDRLTHGFVVDFFDVNLWPLRNYPVFNVADAAIVCGVTVLMIKSLLYSQEAEAGSETL